MTYYLPSACTWILNSLGYLRSIPLGSLPAVDPLHCFLHLDSAFHPDSVPGCSQEDRKDGFDRYVRESSFLPLRHDGQGDHQQ